jgi:undecaprenyl-diphosphatase
MNLLLVIDTCLFLLINHLPHSEISNIIALIISGVGAYGLIWFLIAGIYFLHEEKRDHQFFIPIITTMLLSFVIVELFLKYFVTRPRPSVEIGAIIVDLINNGYSFPSGHAALAFAGVVILSAYEKRYRIWLYLLAALIAFSRIYLGKHYPLDVIFGAMIGFLCGKIALSIHHPYFSKRALQKQKKRQIKV